MTTVKQLDRNLFVLTGADILEVNKVAQQIGLPRRQQLKERGFPMYHINRKEFAHAIYLGVRKEG